MPKVAMPIWALIALPTIWAVSLTCAIVFKSNPTVVQISLLTSFFSTAAAFVIVPVSTYALIANPDLRSFQQIAGTTLCALPVLLILASFFFGGI
ncbi:hypothetical protein [Pseudoxanthomonas yeongjuensis]|uniref:hypothetical protein n=1 Tax=Pseudoxanthomonas yeongjuensis TaxID=377616 RepID=UPI0013909B39|nr:hypothetical protein [Pseudoxanthomonas yeongjuensis]